MLTLSFIPLADSDRSGRIRHTAKAITYPAAATALVYAMQIVMAGLPNVEVVSLLFVLYTIHFRRKTLLIIYGFALLEGIWYGFHLWWIMYLYVWTVLYLIVRLFSRGGHTHKAWFWAIVSGLYGLSFGFLCSFPYLALGGFKTMIAWWMAGLAFDVNHAVWNFILALVLFAPLNRVFTALKIQTI